MSPIFATFILFLSISKLNHAISLKEQNLEAPHKDFDPALYQVALTVTTNNWRSLSTPKIVYFTTFSNHLENLMKKKMVEVTKKNVNMDEYFSIVPEMLKNGEITIAEISLLKTHTLCNKHTPKR